MSYNATGVMANKLGYDTWAAFATDESTPTASGAVEMLQEANFVVNFAYHNSPVNSTVANHTGLLATYEGRVFKRVYLNNHNIEQGKRPYYDEYLFQAERSLLGQLGGNKKIMFKMSRSVPE